jgi:putative oxidoreductase
MSTAPEHVSESAPSKTLHIALWVAQGLLAFAFTGSGAMKVSTPPEALAAKMPWVADSPSFLPALIGGLELLGAAGLILPAVTRVLPVLTPVAASALALVMVLGAGTHVAYGEFPVIGVNVVLGGLAAFVAWGRYRRAPIAPR